MKRLEHALTPEQHAAFRYASRLMMIMPDGVKDQFLFAAGVACGQKDEQVVVAGLRAIDSSDLSGSESEPNWDRVPESPQDESGMFTRKPRYLVLKLSDMSKYLTEESQVVLMCSGDAIAAGRKADGRAPFNAVVVEQDWPEFEPTWAAIEARVTGKAGTGAPWAYACDANPEGGGGFITNFPENYPELEWFPIWRTPAVTIQGPPDFDAAEIAARALEEAAETIKREFGGPPLARLDTTRILRKMARVKRSEGGRG